MKAVVITGRGGAEMLEVREVPDPEARGDLVRVRVQASGINRADLMQARGHYPPPPGVPADRPGLEFAGVIDALGPDVVGPYRLGDRVMGIVAGGGLAGLVVTHPRMLIPIPDNLDFDQAAAVPEVFLTAFDALDARATLRAGESVLIHAVGGGVGSAAVQLAKAMGCTVFGTARSAWKLERCGPYGLDVGIDTSRPAPEGDFAAIVRDRTGGQGVHAVIDHLGAAVWKANIEALRPLGRLVLVGLLGGTRTEVDLAAFLRKRLTVVGTTLRARPIEEKIALTQRFADRVLPWLRAGTVRPIVDRVVPVEDVRAAQEALEANAGFGKIVLRL